MARVKTIIVKLEDGREAVINASDFDKEKFTLIDGEISDDESNQFLEITKENVRQTIFELNPDKDSDWTAQGLPAMKELEAVFGLKLTRADVDDVAGDLTREVVREKLDSDQAEVAGGGV